MAAISHGMMAAVAQTRHGPLARAFIAANRLFGAAALLAGFGLLVDFAVVLARGAPLEGAWWVGVFGLACIAGGVAYLRAPLTRE